MALPDYVVNLSDYVVNISAIELVKRRDARVIYRFGIGTGIL